jgi:hypothetical protein
MSNLITTVENDVIKIFGGLVTTAEIEQLTADALPRPVDADLYTFGVSLRARDEQALNELASLGITSGPLVTLLTTGGAELDAILVPPAGYAIFLWLLQRAVALYDEYSVANTAPVSAAARAVQVKNSPAVQQTQAALVAAQAAQIAALQAELAKYTNPIDAPAPGEAMTPQ